MINTNFKVSKTKGELFESDQKQHNGARYSPCGKFLIAGGYEGSIYRWDVSLSSIDLLDEKPKTLEPLTGHNGWVQAISFSSKNKILYSGDSYGQLIAWEYSKDKSSILWNIEKAHNGWLRNIAVSANEKLIATCGMDKIVKVWSADNGKLLYEFADHNQDVLSLCFHPDNEQLVSGDIYGIIKHWNVKDGKYVRNLDAKVLFAENRLQEVGGVRTLLFDKEGKILLAGGTKPKNGGNVTGSPTILTLDWQSAKTLETTTFGGDNFVYVYDLQLNADGYIMISISGSPGTGKFCFWKIGEKEPFVAENMANCHAISAHPSNKKLAVTTINSNNQGNGRVKGKTDQDYPGNYSPIIFWDILEQT